MEKFDLLLDRYADLLVSYALNIQPGQPFYIQGEIAQRPLIQKMAKKGYERGAPFVHVDFTDPFLLETRLRDTKEESNIERVPRLIKEKYEEMVDEEAASIRLVGSEEPELLAKQDPKRANRYQLALRKAMSRYIAEGVGKSKVAWNVAAGATEGWAKMIFPSLSPKEALHKLWKQIFTICRIYEEDPIAAWKIHNKKLKERAGKLDELKIEKLHFVGPGTDLQVFLTPISTFRGGGDLSHRGVVFEPNIPTEECFTTPHCRKTEGHARVTRPFFVNGKKVDGLSFRFEKGELVTLEAKEGEASFREYISSDAGAKRVGEVALVGCDSPVFQSGTVFQEILFDENAACHIAIGFAYPFCLRGGEKMGPDELDAAGANRSHCHIDMMISDEKVDVTAIGFDGKKTPLIIKGHWVEAFR